MPVDYTNYERNRALVKPRGRRPTPIPKLIFLFESAMSAAHCSICDSDFGAPPRRRVGAVLVTRIYFRDGRESKCRINIFLPREQKTFLVASKVVIVNSFWYVANLLDLKGSDRS